MGFAEGFAVGSSGMRGALQFGLDKQRQDKELALQDEAAARTREEFGWRRDDRQRLDDAYSSYGQLGLPTTTGGPTTGNFARMDRGQDPEEIDPVVVTPAATGAAADLAREQALERIAIASRNPDMIRSSALAQRQLHMSGIASDAMKAKLSDIEGQLPQLNTNSSGYPMLYTGKSKNGYTFLTTESDGSPGQRMTMNESQLRQFYLAHQLGEAGYGTEAMSTLNSAHKDLGDHVARWNEASTKMATTNNAGVHDANMDANSAITARAAQTSAGATAALARSHSGYYDQLTSEAQQNRKDSMSAREVADEFDSLTPEEQAGPTGAGLVRKYNMLNAKPGQMVPLRGDAGAGKLPQTLTDQEKLGYSEAVKEIALLGPKDRTPDKLAAVYRAYNLDPAKFGVQGLPSWGGGNAGSEGASAPAAIPGRPLYGVDTRTLQQRSVKTRGISQAEANAAAAELAARQGEARIGPVR